MYTLEIQQVRGLIAQVTKLSETNNFATTYWELRP